LRPAVGKIVKVGEAARLTADNRGDGMRLFGKGSPILALSAKGRGVV
jgi:hypothetical protein